MTAWIHSPQMLKEIMNLLHSRRRSMIRSTISSTNSKTYPVGSKQAISSIWVMIKTQQKTRASKFLSFPTFPTSNSKSLDQESLICRGSFCSGMSSSVSMKGRHRRMRDTSASSSSRCSSYRTNTLHLLSFPALSRSSCSQKARANIDNSIRRHWSRCRNWGLTSFPM